MKPSERIVQIIEKIWESNGKKDITPPMVTDAIMTYLDEQYQKNNPQCFCKEIGCSKNEHTYKAELK